MEKKLINYEGFEAYAQRVRDKYAEKKDIPTSLSSLQEDSTHQTVTNTEKTKWNKVTSKVDKVSGKGLSTNDYTNADKAKVDAIPPNPKYTDTIPDLSGYAKKESIPTKLSQLTNDKNFKTESEIQSMIEKASSLKKEVVTSLSTTGKDDVIYLVKDEKGKDNNNYLEYLWLNDKYELIGSTQVDLSGYAQRTELTQCENTIYALQGDMRKANENLNNKLDREDDKASFEDVNAGKGRGKYVDASLLHSVKNDLYANVLQWIAENATYEEFTQQELEEAFK